jgi:hypothetical protein
MPDLITLVKNAMADGTFATIARNAGAQFGTPARRYLGATILPEKTVMKNMYREEGVRYRTIIANDGTRYSPAQKKKGELFGSMLVELGHSDIAREITAEEYDALIDYLQRNVSMEAMAQIIDWVDVTLNRALLEHNEKQRWQAIVSASITRLGDNEYTEIVSYPNPSGHRANAGGTWSSDAYDPFDDILARADLLEGKGFTVNRIIASRPVISILSGNDKVKARTGVATISVTGQIQATAGRASLDAMNMALEKDGLPPIERYDLQYRTQTGTARFLASNVFVMLATTGRDETIDLGDNEELLTDTLGYTAIGRAAGQATPGRVVRMEAFDNKPPRIEGEAWQTSLPVITEPEAIAVIGGIS